MGLSRTVSEINGDFSRKSQTFPTYGVFAHAEVVAFGIGYRHIGSKIRIMWIPGYRAEKEV